MFETVFLPLESDMQLINQLSQNLVNKIAAGEVVERPSSVIKELIENAVDAGATRIDITVEKGGFELLRVVDNGCGIAADQLPLAVAPHATSKLATADDLFRISTFGFRGEALASIAEISQCTIRSRTAEADAGAEITVRGGESSEVSPTSCAVGTTIEVRNLFFNTPVRRKFLRSVQTEFGYITEALIRIALATPSVYFTLTHQGKQTQNLPAVADTRQRIAAIFGREISDALQPIHANDPQTQIRVFGYAALPTVNRSNNRTQYIFLNGRHIRDRAILAAVTEAYRGLIMVGRFPIVFLSIEMPHDHVDVNVHPTKLEVRFQDSGKLYGLILSAIRDQFLRSDLVKPILRDTGMDDANGDATLGMLPNLAPEAADGLLEEQMRGEIRRWANDAVGSPNGGGANVVNPPPADRIMASNILPVSFARGGFAPFKPFPDAGNRLGSDLLGAVDRPTLPSVGGNLSGSAASRSVHRFGEEEDAECEPLTNMALDGDRSKDAASSVRNATPLEKFTEFLKFDTSDEECEASKEPYIDDERDRHGVHDGGNDHADDYLEDSNDPAEDAAELARQIREVFTGQTPMPTTLAERQKFEEKLGHFEQILESQSCVPGVVRGKSLRAIQMHRSWLVVETPEGIRIVDQHALHERILYERLKQLYSKSVPSQALLVPEPVDLSPVEAAAARDQIERFARLGLKIEPFGGDTILITGYPAISRRVQPVEMFLALLERVIQGIREPKQEDLMEGLLEEMACKAAVKAGDLLAPEEIQDLLEQGLECPDFHHCPHGRPSTLELTNSDLEKHFRRTGPA